MECLSVQAKYWGVVLRNTFLYLQSFIEHSDVNEPCLLLGFKVKLLCGYTMHFYEKYYEFEKHENCKSILFTVEFHLRKSICVLFRQV